MEEPKRVRMRDTWAPRDLPALVAIAEKIESGERGIRARHLAAELGWEFADVVTAIDALSHGYVEAKPLDAWGNRFDWGVFRLTEAGRRAAGLWPDGDGLDAFLDALRRAEMETSDAEERTLIRRAAGAVGSVSREIMIEVIAAVIARQADERKRVADSGRASM